MSDAGRRLAIAGVMIAACAAVVVAARGDYGDGTSAALTVGDGTRTVAGVVGLLLTVLAVGVIVWAFRPVRGQRGELRQRTWRDAVTIVVVALLIATLIQSMKPQRRTGTAADEARTELGGNSPAEAAPASDVLRERADAAASLLLAAAAVGVVAAAALGGARRRHRRAPQASTAPSSDPTDDTNGADGWARGEHGPPLRAAVDAARHETDPRRSIALAFKAAELALDRTPQRRHRDHTPREWLVAAGRPFSGADALGRLVAQYEIARFSDHDPTDRQRTIALVALDDIMAVADTNRHDA